MNKYFNFLSQNLLFKVTSFNSIALLLRMLAGVISSKVTALYLGPDGVALIGNFRNFFAISESITTLGLYNGIVKYSAEFKTKKEELKGILSTSFIMIVVASILVSLCLFFGASHWDKLIFGSESNFSYIFKGLSCALPLYAVHVFIYAVINGTSLYKKHIIINIILSITSLLITIFFIITMNLSGALWAIVINPAIALIITLFFRSVKDTIIKLISLRKISFVNVKLMGEYTMMSLISAVLSPILLILIRNEIIDKVGIEGAGFWEGMQRISNQYMGFVSSIFVLYILPKFSVIESKELFRKEVFNFYKTILPLFIVGLVFVYFLRKDIITIFLTEEFIPMESIFIWQLSGDVFKVASLVIGYQFWAKKMFWHFVGTEIFSVVFLYVLSNYFIGEYGFLGASMAHFFNYILYLLILLIIFRKSLMPYKWIK